MYLHLIGDTEEVHSLYIKQPIKCEYVFLLHNC